MSDYMLEVEIDGKPNRTMLSAIPASVIVRFYRVDRTEDLVVLAEKVLK